MRRPILAALLLAFCATQALAQFPDRPVRVIVPFGPGGLADITFRVVAEKLTGLLGKPVLVENQPGAGGIAAAGTVTKSKPDGHTLLVIANGTAISKSLFKNLPYDPVKDLTPVALVAYFDLVVLAKGDGRHKTLADLVGAARAAPGKLNFGSINPGSTQNLSAELFKTTAGIDVPIIPFRTSNDAAAAVVSGELDAVFESYTAMKGLIDSGRLRPLASTGTRRSTYLPELPTVAEAGVPGYEVVGWNALAAPAGTPDEVVAILNRHVNTVTTMPEVRARFAQLGNEAHAGPPEDLRRRLAADIVKREAVIKRAGIPQQ
jgi:tripartite-type tricarboxylate transporter receptor subunit TctC